MSRHLSNVYPMTSARTASREFLAVELPEFYVMVNGSHYLAPMGLSAAEDTAAAYQAIYPLAIVKVENVNEFAAWRS